MCEMTTRGGIEGDSEPKDLHVFVSYRRIDLDRVSPLLEGLRRSGQTVWVDTSELQAGAAWWDEIENAIRDAAVVVVMLTQRYLTSEVCLRELVSAREAGKRILPVQLEDIDSSALSEDHWLRGIHWVVPKSDTELTDSAESSVRSIVSAVRSDPGWTRTHAVLLQQAHGWAAGGKRSNRLLKGNDITAAEIELSKARHGDGPRPTELQRTYISASRRHHRRVRRAAISTVALVTAGSLSLAAVAVIQWRAQSEQRARAEQALAESEFERLLANADNAPTRMDAVEAALAASALGITRPPLVERLNSTLLRTDADRERPIVEYVSAADEQFASGTRQGADVSRDGGTLAVADPTGQTVIVDLWNLRTIGRLQPSSGQGLGTYLALNPDGSKLARITPGYDAALAESAAEPSTTPTETVSAVPVEERTLLDHPTQVELWNLEAEPAELIDERSIRLDDDLMGATFGPDDDTLVLIEQSTVGVIVDLGSDISAEPRRLGSPMSRTAADFYSMSVSSDGNRICITDGSYYQVDPPQLLGRFDDADGCLADSCGLGGRGSLVLRFSTLDCRELDGAFTTIEFDCYSCIPANGFGDARVRPFRRPQMLAAASSEGIVVPGPISDRLVLIGDGRVSVFASGGGLPADHEMTPQSTVDRVAPGPRLSMSAVATSGTIRILDRGGLAARVVTRRDEVLDLWIDDEQVVWRDNEGVHTIDQRTSDPRLMISGASDSIAAVAGGRIAVATAEVVVTDTLTGTGPRTIDAEDRICAVGLSANGRYLVMATCPTDTLLGDLLVADLTQGAPFASLVARSPIVNVATVRISDDGRLIGAANRIGQVAVLRDGVSIGPVTLLTEPEPTNQYQEGWLELSHDGRLLATRRNFEGIVLWAVSTDSVEPAGRLDVAQTIEGLTEPPTFAAWSDGRLRIGWGPGVDVPEGFAAEWDLTEASVLRRLCQEWINDPGDSTLDSLTLRPPDCRDARPVERGRPPTPPISEAIAPSGPDRWSITDARAVGIQGVTVSKVAHSGTDVAFTGFGGSGTAIGRWDPSGENSVVRLTTAIASAIDAGTSGDVWVGAVADNGIRIRQYSPTLELITDIEAGDQPGNALAAGSAGVFVATANGVFGVRRGALVELESKAVLPPGLVWSDGATRSTAQGDRPVAAFVGYHAEGETTYVAVVNVDRTVDVFAAVRERHDLVSIGGDGTIWLSPEITFADGRPDSVVRFIPTDRPTGTVTVPSQSIKGMQADDDGNLWFVTGSAIGRIDTDGVTTVNEVPGGSFFSGISVDTSRQQIVVASTSDGLVALRYEG